MSRAAPEWTARCSENRSFVPVKAVLELRKETNSGAKVTQILSLTADRGVIRYEDKGAVGNKVSEDISRYSIVHPGDIVLNSMNVIIGSVGLSKYHGALSPVYYVMKPRVPEGVDIRFLAYHFDIGAFQKQLIRIGYGILDHRMRIPWINLREETLVMPPLAEQRAIADYLDAETARIDALIAKKQTLIHLLEERWVAHRNSETLRGVNPITGEGTVPANWSVAQLGVLTQLQRGHDLPHESRRSGSVPIVSSGGISGYHDTAAAFGPGVVTGRYGTVGEVFFVEEPFWPLNTTLYVVDFRSNDPRWTAYVLESLPLDAEAEKSAVGGINRNVIGKLRVPHPPPDVQEAIAERLTEASAHVVSTTSALTRQIALLTERRQALITAAVTGEFAVPGAP